MAETAKKLREKTLRIRYFHFPDIWLLMVYCFIQVICFRQNIKMGLLLLFMDHGTGRLNLKKAIWWLLYLSRTESQAVTGKYLLIILPGGRNLCHPAVRNTGLAD